MVMPALRLLLFFHLSSASLYLLPRVSSADPLLTRVKRVSHEGDDSASGSVVAAAAAPADPQDGGYPSSMVSGSSRSGYHDRRFSQSSSPFTSDVTTSEVEWLTREAVSEVKKVLQVNMQRFDGTCASLSLLLVPRLAFPSYTASPFDAVFR